MNKSTVSEKSTTRSISLSSADASLEYDPKIPIRLILYFLRMPALSRNVLIMKLLVIIFKFNYRGYEQSSRLCKQAEVIPLRAKFP
ncbi:MAG: hypothetical protein ACYDH2_15565, partial [Anaerolineaceae bacterium]